MINASQAKALKKQRDAYNDNVAKDLERIREKLSGIVEELIDNKIKETIKQGGQVVEIIALTIGLKVSLFNNISVSDVINSLKSKDLLISDEKTNVLEKKINFPSVVSQTMKNYANTTDLHTKIVPASGLLLINLDNLPNTETNDLFSF